MAVESQATLTVNNVFRDLMRKLSKDEYKTLEENIIEEGRAIDPIVVWDDTIIDGHNRYNICTEHDIPFTTHRMEFANEHEAKMWIIQNQYGRRNLTQHEMSYIRGQIVLNTSRVRTNRGEAVKRMAESSGVSPRTVRNDMTFAKQVDGMEPTVKDDILNGNINVTKAEVAKLSEVSAGDQKDAVKKVKAGKLPSVAKALPDSDSLTNMAVPYRRAVLDIQRIIRDMDSICTDPVRGAYIATKQTRYQTLLKEAEDIFKQCEPSEECDKCGGAGCNNCYSTGFLSRTGVESRDK